MSTPRPGEMAWLDLTVDDADAVRDFYASVVGWTASPVDMGDYSDYAMTDAGGTARAGVCHRRGSNDRLPAVWVPYFVVADLDASVERCVELGGQVVDDRRGSGFVVVADPAGAVCALYRAPSD